MTSTIAISAPRASDFDTGLDVVTGAFSAFHISSKLVSLSEYGTVLTCTFWSSSHPHEGTDGRNVACNCGATGRWPPVQGGSMASRG